MKSIDPRVHRLLDAESSAKEESALRAEIARDPAAERDRAVLEWAIGRARSAPAFELPEDFEVRVMARAAARPAPRARGWEGWLRLSRLREVSWTGALALAGLLVVVALGGAWGGYRAGVHRASRPGAEATASAPSTVVVRFAVKLPEARRVELAGSFNGWGEKGIALEKSGADLWNASVELPRGRYEYTFVVDGQRWIPDLSAAELVDDGFGGRNAVLEI
jgi:anti-sigma factor RsiW